MAGNGIATSLTLLAVSVLFVKGGSGGGLELGGPRGTSAGYRVQLQQQLPHHSHQGQFGAMVRGMDGKWLRYQDLTA